MNGLLKIVSLIFLSTIAVLAVTFGTGHSLLSPASNDYLQKDQTAPALNRPIIAPGQDGTNDATFDPGTGALGGVREWDDALVQPDGKILVVGLFGTYDGVGRNYVARIDSSGALDPTFSSAYGADNRVTAVALQPDGKIVLVGAFNTYNGVQSSKIARLNSDGTLDPTFSIGAGFDDTPSSVVVQNDGKIVVAGSFSSYRGVTRNKMVRINPDGSVDSSFDPGNGANAVITNLLLTRESKYLVFGEFSSFSGVPRNKIARIHSNGTLDTLFESLPGPDGPILDALELPDGNFILVGGFTTFNSIPSNRVSKVRQDGSVETSFNTGGGANGTILGVTLVNDNQLAVAGSFTSFGGSPRNCVAMLNSDGLVNHDFNPGTGISTFGEFARGILAVSSDRLIVNGNFKTYRGSNRAGLARISISGVLDESFEPGFGLRMEGRVQYIKKQPDTRILLAGSFEVVSGTQRRSLARLLSDGSIDTTFSPVEPNSNVEVIELQPDGKVLVGGQFSALGLSTKHGIGRLNSDGSLDQTFGSNPGTGGGGVFAVAVQPDGRILIAGTFSSYGGVARNRIARLNADGSVDPSFNPGTGLQGGGSLPVSIALQTDGRILVGGGISDCKWSF